MLLKDERYSISTFQGRINLYCLLLHHHFKDEVIKRCLDRVEKMCENDASEFNIYNAQNLLIPATLEELNLRIRLLWGATTSLHTIALEGQKRQFCMTWSELGLKFSSRPFKSFYLLKKKERFSHRQTPNDPAANAFKSLLNQATKLYYERAAVSIRSYFFVLGTSCPGVTRAMCEMIERRSTESAVQNYKIQEKSIAGYIKDVVKECKKWMNIVDAIYVPVELEARPRCHEKPMAEQNIFMKRFFTEIFAKLALETNNPDFSDLYTPISDRFVEQLGRFNDPDETTKKKLWLDPETKEAKAADKECWKTMETYISNKKEWTTKWFFLDPKSYDPVLVRMAAKLCVPKDIDATKARDPRNVEWYYGYWVSNHKEVGYVTKWHQNFSTSWSPISFQILSALFSHAVFDLKTLDQFIDLIDNNGYKDTKDYLEGAYIHELTTLKDPVDLVSSSHNNRKIILRLLMSN